MSGKKLYVMINDTTTINDLYTYFLPFGTIITITILWNYDNKAYALLNFGNDAIIQDVLTKEKHVLEDGFEMTVVATPPSKEVQTKKRKLYTSRDSEECYKQRKLN